MSIDPASRVPCAGMPSAGKSKYGRGVEHWPCNRNQTDSCTTFQCQAFNARTRRHAENQVHDCLLKSGALDSPRLVQGLLQLSVSLPSNMPHIAEHETGLPACLFLRARGPVMTSSLSHAPQGPSASSVCDNACALRTALRCHSTSSLQARMIHCLPCLLSVL